MSLDLMPMPSPDLEAPYALAAELRELQRREAWYRKKTTEEVANLQHRIAALTARVEALKGELGERDAYIHQLHEERDATNRHHLAEQQRCATEIHHLHQERGTLRDAEHAARRDAEFFVQRLSTAEKERDQARNQIRHWRTSPLWGLAKYLLARGAPPAAPDSRSLYGQAATSRAGLSPEDVAVTYFLHTSPFRRFEAPEFVLRGWAFAGRPGRTISAIRARIDERIIDGSYGLDEPDVVRLHDLDQRQPLPGFTIPLALTPGQRFLVLEAHVDTIGWTPFLSTPIWIEARGTT